MLGEEDFEFGFGGVEAVDIELENSRWKLRRRGPRTPGTRIRVDVTGKEN